MQHTVEKVARKSIACNTMIQGIRLLILAIVCMAWALRSAKTYGMFWLASDNVIARCQWSPLSGPFRNGVGVLYPLLSCLASYWLGVRISRWDGAWIDQRTVQYTIRSTMSHRCERRRELLPCHCCPQNRKLWPQTLGFSCSTVCMSKCMWQWQLIALSHLPTAPSRKSLAEAEILRLLLCATVLYWRIWFSESGVQMPFGRDSKVVAIVAGSLHHDKDPVRYHTFTILCSTVLYSAQWRVEVSKLRN